MIWDFIDGNGVKNADKYSKTIQICTKSTKQCVFFLNWKNMKNID